MPPEHHISTDEVFGPGTEGRFSETTPYAPAVLLRRKAASDHLVQARTTPLVFRGAHQLLKQ